MFNWLTNNRREAAPVRIEPTLALADGETAMSSDSVRMFEVFGDVRTSAGAVVNAETAMRVSAVYACVSLISGSIAQLPLPVFERLQDARERADHDYWWLLNEQFCAGWSAAAGWEFLVSQMLLRGDGIAYLTRNRAGAVTGVIPWPRDRVSIAKQPRSSLREAAKLQYTFHDQEGFFTADQDDVLHIPGFGFNGVTSMSVIQWGARNGIGIAIRGDEHAGKFFSEGGKPEVAITATGKMGPDLQEDFRQAWVAKYGGINGNSRIPLILTEGLDVKELTMSAVDQQLLESRQWQVVDVARAFGVPPHMIGETAKVSSFGTGIEQMFIGFVMMTIGPHLKRIRDELNRKLFRTPRYFTEHNVAALMAGDSKARAEYYAKALGGPGTQGYMAVDEVRRIQNLPPMGGEFATVMKAGAAPANPDKPEEPDDADPEAAPTGA